MEAMTLFEWVFDGLIGIMLLWLAWVTLFGRDLFRSIVLFIAFGLLMALAWVRLDALDIALAEAAIGAGLTGALLLTALTRLHSAVASDGTALARDYRHSSHWVPAVLLAFTMVGLGYVVAVLPAQVPELSYDVVANLNASGVTNPVTAVLLNFRSYDTFLEMAVLVVALLGVWSLGSQPAFIEPAAGPVLQFLTRLITPMLILVAAYLLWAGAHAPGGAFQAGSVLGAAVVLMSLAGWKPHSYFSGFLLRLIIIIGPAMFITIGLITLIVKGQLLEYPLPYAGRLILILEAAATVSIATILGMLFLGTNTDIQDDQ